MAKNHGVTKRNRRPLNKNRKDYTAGTMAALKELERQERNRGVITEVLGDEFSGVRAKFLERPDVVALSPENQDAAWKLFRVKVEGFVADLSRCSNPIVVPVAR